MDTSVEINSASNVGLITLKETVLFRNDFPKKPKPYRIIAYDFESEHVSMNDVKQSLKHNVNFICAQVRNA